MPRHPQRQLGRAPGHARDGRGPDDPRHAPGLPDDPPGAGRPRARGTPTEGQMGDSPFSFLLAFTKISSLTHASDRVQ
jgi:hypothetical protein